MDFGTAKCILLQNLSCKSLKVNGIRTIGLAFGTHHGPVWSLPSVRKSLETSWKKLRTFQFQELIQQNPKLACKLKFSNSIILSYLRLGLKTRISPRKLISKELLS